MRRHRSRVALVNGGGGCGGQLFAAQPVNGVRGVVHLMADVVDDEALLVDGAHRRQMGANAAAHRAGRGPVDFRVGDEQVTVAGVRHEAIVGARRGGYEMKEEWVERGWWNDVWSFSSAIFGL